VLVCGNRFAFLGAFSTLWKMDISFVVSARPSVGPHGTIRHPLDWSCDLKFEGFPKICSGNQSVI